MSIITSHWSWGGVDIPNTHHKYPNSGFTLIEVLIALTLLAFLGFWTSQSISQAVRSKKKIEKIVDKSGLLRDALQVIREDVNKAFHYHDINVDLYNESQKERIKNCEKNTKKTKKDSSRHRGGSSSSSSQTIQQRCTELRRKFKKKGQKGLTQFQGDTDYLHFTSLSHIRAKKNSKLSHQSEVGYFLKDCKGRLDKKSSSQCLWRRINPIIDNRVEEGGREIVLLEHVTEFQLRYLGPEKEEGKAWVEKWKTGENADDLTRGKFPSAVEVTITLKDKRKEKDKKISMTTVAAIRFPNNEILNKEALKTHSPTKPVTGRPDPRLIPGSGHTKK